MRCISVTILLPALKFEAHNMQIKIQYAALSITKVELEKSDMFCYRLFRSVRGRPPCFASVALMKRKLLCVLRHTSCVTYMRHQHVAKQRMN